jgi:hypothetical protein
MCRVIAAVCLSVVLAGCSSSSNGSTDNPKDACTSFVTTICTKLFACEPTAAAAAFTNQQGCVTALSADASCATAACGTGKTFNSGQAQTCLNDYSNQSCSDAEAGTVPASCNTVCQ